MKYFKSANVQMLKLEKCRYSNEKVFPSISFGKNRTIAYILLAYQHGHSPYNGITTLIDNGSSLFRPVTSKDI